MEITINELRQMKHKEGMILQGCGGDIQEWVIGINELLTQEDILLEGTKFENVRSFFHEGSTNLLFPFEDVKLDFGRLYGGFVVMGHLEAHGCLIMLQTN